MNDTGMVLIIDDDQVLRSTLTRILEKAGCQTYTAGSGAEALAILEQRPVDLIYLDIQLPEVDGLQVLEQVRKKYPRLPVILLTGYGTIQSAIQALRLGAADYLLKPLDPEVLISRTRIALREQAVERRKKEIQSQIAALQAEYQTLEFESGSSPSLATMPVERILSGVKERFIKRGRLILDAQAQRATFGGRVLVLPPSAFDYLAVLANHSPDVVAYQDLVREAQGYQINSSEARELAKWHVHVLRQALEEDPQKPSWLLNLRGVGYRLLLE